MVFWLLCYIKFQEKSKCFHFFDQIYPDCDAYMQVSFYYAQIYKFIICKSNIFAARKKI